MPYRYAHYVILLVLVPAIAVAFTPRYFGDLPAASFAFHVHGVTASLWVLLVMAQSWTAHAKRFALHKVVARSVLVLVPLFAAGGVLAMQSMAEKFVTKSDPFYAALGARLGLDDVVATTALVLMVRAAIVNRRRMGLHAAYMLSTVLLVLSPVVARLPIPLIPHLGDTITIAVALTLYAMRRRDGRPFLIVAALSVLRVVQFHTLAASEWWAERFGALVGMSSIALAFAAILVAGLAVWTVWPWPRRAVSAAV